MNEDARLFFSIVVPAHNEAGYIEDTLRHLAALDYPKDRYEVIVVENGSIDGTLEKCKAFERPGWYIFSIHEKGVSRARNYGADRVQEAADWILFLDADTVIQSGFLKEIEDFVSRHAAYAVGAVTVQPLSERKIIRGIYAACNFWQGLTKSPYAAFFVRRDLMHELRFVSDQDVREDVQLVAQAAKRGRFFFFHTQSVFTSSRRLEHDGLARTIFFWVMVMCLPASIQKKITYTAVR